jgi:hypothetical protein
MLQFLSDNAALLVAICALAYTAYEVRVQRAHNRLTVRPHLSTFTHTSRTDTAVLFHAQVVNNGLGPAFIKDFEAYLDGKPCDLRAALKEVLGEKKADTSSTVLGTEYAMAANETKDIFVVRFPCKSDEEFQHVGKNLDRIDIKVEYECGYGTRRILDSRTEG